MILAISYGEEYFFILFLSTKQTYLGMYLKVNDVPEALNWSIMRLKAFYRSIEIRFPNDNFHTMSMASLVVCLSNGSLSWLNILNQLYVSYNGCDNALLRLCEIGCIRFGVKIFFTSSSHNLAPAP